MKILEKGLVKMPELSTFHDVGHVLVQILDKAKFHLGASWLSGNLNLNESDLNCLGVPGPLGDDTIPEIMKRLGRLPLRTGADNPRHRPIGYPGKTRSNT